MIQTVVTRALAKGFRSAGFYSEVANAVHNCVSEPPSVDVVSAKLVDSHSFTVPPETFVKQEVEKNSLDKSKMERRFVKIGEVVEEKNNKVENQIPTKRVDTARSPSR